MSTAVDAVVVGAGVVGLACARALALAGREVIVLEKNRAIGEETSARNSEVIHAGLYYPAGSFKARFCVAGKHLLYRYCEEKGVPHRRCGKVLVAVSEAQNAKLEAIRRSSHANGVTDVERLTAEQVARLEPAVRAAAGLWSPSTGIVDSHALMLALRGDLEQAGGAVAVLTRFVGARAHGAGWTLECETEDGPFELDAGVVVNAGGLFATRVARALEPSADDIPDAIYAKGNYFALAAKSPFTHLVYPLPEEGGLGVHATLDLAGRARFGPDVEWLPNGVPDAFDYDVDARRGDAFYAAIRTYWPELPDGALEPAYSGVRPKIGRAGRPLEDFVIREHGNPRAVHLLGVESPGLTSALAIGEHVVRLLAG